MKRLLLPLLSLLILQQLSAQQQVTFAEHIAPIIYNNCTTCHRPGEVAPFSLTSYADAAAFAPMIKYVTQVRYMPPWKPDPAYSHFLGERALTDEQIDLIAQWADAGAPRGDAALEPPLPDFPDGSILGAPDLVLSFSEAYRHGGDLEDQYQIFVLPTGLTEDKDIAAVELRPGNSRIVHHALFSYDETGQAAARDADSAEYGYPASGGGWGVPGAGQRQFPGYVPGQVPRFYPEGIAQKLPAGSDFLVQMHYAPVPTDELDSSTVNIFYKHEPVTRYAKEYIMVPFGNTLTNGPFVMPANTVKTFHGVFEVPYDVSLLGVGPHMHLLGRDWEVFLVHPNGDTTNLIRINDWDFNWQGSYFFPGYVVAEAGTEIHAYATYDNTASNPFNPNNPPRLVTWGEGTADEMFYLPFFYVDYMNGDEDVVFEEVTTSTREPDGILFPTNKLFPIYPNPSEGEITIGYSLEASARVSLDLLDLNGKLIARLQDQVLHPAGWHQWKGTLDGYPAGAYLVQLHGRGFTVSQQVVLH